MPRLDSSVWATNTIHQQILAGTLPLPTLIFSLSCPFSFFREASSYWTRDTRVAMDLEQQQNPQRQLQQMILPANSTRIQIPTSLEAFRLVSILSGMVHQGASLSTHTRL